jgi:hypothetical protein
VLNKNCPQCGTSQPREDILMCDCNEIVCMDQQCRIDHLFESHFNPRSIEDEEWEDID